MRKNMSTGNGGGNGQAEAGFFWVKGDGNVVDRALQTFRDTFGGGARVVTVTQAAVSMPKPVTAGALPPGSNEGATDDVAESTAMTEENMTPEAGPVAAPGPRKPQKYKLVRELDPESGDMPLAKFCEGKDSKEWRARIILCATWMRDHRNKAEFTAADVYTLLKHQWSSAPDDTGGALRDMTRHELLERGDAPRSFKLSMMAEKKMKKMENGG